MDPSSGLLNKIVEWATANGAKLEEAYKLKGGWEGWTQVELALTLKRAYELQFGRDSVTVTREDNVYNNAPNQRSDLLLTTRNGGQIFTNMIELKCESIANAANFVREVSGDCTKVNSGVINAIHRPCKAWVVAFSVSNNMANNQAGANPLRVDGTPLAVYRTIQAGGTPITMWWGSKNFP
ncbi:hypothetical protein GYMLUDRAFT_82161 [Collybiopsis luxurians FD-317 M1]|nr:hypothetical protein GYMLUDRAFT_82161 [Collybiopsis luxurians FD-317 M1]